VETASEDGGRHLAGIPAVGDGESEQPKNVSERKLCNKSVSCSMHQWLKDTNGGRQVGGRRVANNIRVPNLVDSNGGRSIVSLAT
jgi:hypothetical protein